MGANIAGIYGAQIFRNDDRPRYRRGFSIACAILAFGLCLALVRYIDDMIRKRRKTRQVESPASEDSDFAVPPAQEIPAPPVDGRRTSI
jgi:peptidoglycan/LPS O-acetylase OafA/YrhL